MNFKRDLDTLPPPSEKRLVKNLMRITDRNQADEEEARRKLQDISVRADFYRKAGLSR